MGRTDFHSLEKNVYIYTMEINGYRHLTGYGHSLQYLCLCSAEEIYTGLEQLESE